MPWVVMAVVKLVEITSPKITSGLIGLLKFRFSYYATGDDIVSSSGRRLGGSLNFFGVDELQVRTPTCDAYNAVEV